MSLICLSIVGCGPKSDLLSVSGAVSVNGNPVKSGSIRFTSVGTEKVASTGAMISEGEFEIPQAKGLPPGTYHIVISAADKDAPKIMLRDASGRPQMEVAPDLIPEEYNVKSEVTIDVSVEGENHFVFDIQK